MPAAALTTITNISVQTVPILVNSIDSDRANDASDVAASQTSQLQMTPGSQLTVESQRLDPGQLEQMARMRLITYTSV